ncbi:type II secretion system protein [Neptunomonas sp. XY-337]|uniref:type II secretion system protein n=1 Tax=Neptunomonas sp. XY-337 TaxID=2561897 RepID=UPI0010A9DA45|nr:type II secretion system protein [Neptunomonas sp. XY-337]
MRKQRGFTLIELLVVVSILAAMATISVSVVGGYDQKARAELVEVEMKTIANAIYRFHRDTGYFPKTGLFATAASPHAANMGYLFSSPLNASNDEILPWNTDAGRGWNGPYLTTDSKQRWHIQSGGVSDCDLPAVAIVDSFPAMEDPFLIQRTYSDSNECFAIHSDGNWIPKEYSGQPYQYFTNFTNDNYPDCPTTGSGCIALLSFGPDGNFDNGDNDDVVRVLRMN